MNGAPIPRSGVSICFKWQKKPRSTKKNLDSATDMSMEQIWKEPEMTHNIIPRTTIILDRPFLWNMFVVVSRLSY
jgi:hypothetical protein